MVNSQIFSGSNISFRDCFIQISKVDSFSVLLTQIPELFIQISVKYEFLLKNDNTPTKKRVVKSWFFRRTDINCLYFLPQIIGSHESCTSKRFLDKNPKINLKIFIGPRGGRYLGIFVPGIPHFGGKCFFFIYHLICMNSELIEKFHV